VRRELEKEEAADQGSPNRAPFYSARGNVVVAGFQSWASHGPGQHLGLRPALEKGQYYPVFIFS
jgi:hypothetical protein